MTKSTTHLTAGDIVATSLPDGTDFGLPLVAPTTRQVRNRVNREVRNVLHARGGMVVWFTDGTKTRPLHGRTSWMVS